MPDLSLPAAILATQLPFAAFGAILLFTRTTPRLSAFLSVGAASATLLGALYLLAWHWHLRSPIEYTTRWLATGRVEIPVGFLLDPVSLQMFAIVAVVSLLVQIYSIGYMAGDPGFARYFAFLSLFAWAMANLTLSPSMLQLYIFWELVGLSSYLLIGFWYEKFSASQAGKKAFVMTRVGDVALFVGILLVLVHFGDLSIREMNGPGLAAGMPPHLVTLCALLIFGGIVGKSAQFPLLTWLPDAMEGPTPVSALLHSATMVAAGVFLFGRLFPFFSRSPAAMTVFLAVGTAGMLLASTMAMVSRDIKQIWAYSTISQLGLMIMGLAAGGFFAGMFHLTTHAAFKSLLFLCSGVLIHTFETNDIFELAGRGARRLKVCMTCLVIAGAALAGLPPVSGFFSKELIIGRLAGANPVWLIAGLLGVFLTAYYTFRAIFVVLFPKTGGKARRKAETHGGYGVMVWPLVVLAAFTALLGLAQGPLAEFLAGARGAHPAEQPAWLLSATLAAAVLGVGISWAEFGRAGAAQVGFAERLEPVRRLFAERWYIDRFYRWLVNVVVDRGVSRLCAENDRRVIDGAIDELSEGVVKTGGAVSSLHSAMIQYRLLALFAAVILMGLYFVVP